jgi:phosphatidylglycerol---prolipoprotein diacylglyceryl transferase
MPYLHVPPIELGPVTIHAFGIITVFAILLGAKAARHRAGELKLDVRVVDRLVPWLVLGVFVGAHLVSVVFYSPVRIVEDPLILIKLWDGISSFGGIFGGLVVAYLFFRRLKLRMKHYTQALLFGAVVCLLVGRFGCSVAHDHPGKETDSPIAVKGWPTSETPKRSLGFYTDGPRRHDLGLYEFVYLIPVTGLLYAVRRFQSFENFHLALVLFLYTPVRFLLDFLRSGDTLYFGLTPGQYFAIALFLVAIVLTIGVLRQGMGRKPPAVSS